MLNRLASNWSRVEREKLNTNWSIIENYLSKLQGQINLLTGDVDVQELINQINEILNQGNVIIGDLETALQEATNVIANAQDATTDANNATFEANNAAQSALNAINDIQSMIDNFSVKGIYDNDTIYSKNNSVYHEGSSYIYTNNTASKGNPPPNYPTVSNTYWQMTAAKGASGDGAVSKVNGKEPDGAGEVILTASDVGAASAEQLEQLEQTTENHITNTDKHLQTGERDKIKNALQPSTYNASNTITNVGANRATRVFPQINWAATGIELWETNFSLPNSVWGILELDIAGYSSAAGGAKIVLELGINVINQSQPSTEFRNYMKVITSSIGFVENFYVEVEHRPSVRGVYIKVYKRAYNDPVTITATFTSTVNPMSAFEFLKGFHNGALFTNIASVPSTRQKDFDARITENFTSVSNGKAVVNQAVTDMGIYTAPDAPFEVTATNIRKLGGRVFTGNIATPEVPNRGDVSVYSTLIDFKPTYAFSDWGGMVYIKDRYIGPTGLLTASPQGGGEMVQAIGVQQIGNQWRMQFSLTNYSSMTKPASSLNYYIFA